MALPIYLAMTAWEMGHRQMPPHCGWMACHFSPYTQGLSNLPQQLPEKSLLILNDRIPPWKHDPELIADQVRQMVETLSPTGILLDFQRPYMKELAAVINKIAELPYPVAVTEPYAKDCDCAVFLPPAPLHRPLQQTLSAWEGRRIWLEIGTAGLTMTLTRSGCKLMQEDIQLGAPSFSDPELHCHYSIALQEDQAVFSLTRTPDDILSLLQEAEVLGVTLATGLYQELSSVLFVHGPA